MSTSVKSRDTEDSRSSTEAFLSGKLAQVDIGAIEKELKALWRNAAHSDAEHESSSVTRACVMNFLLYTEDPNAESDTTDLLDNITTRHPCRAILVICREGNEQRALDAWVSARCHISDSKANKQICCEQVTVRGTNVSRKEIASVVVPLVVPDLPVFLWWNADGLTNEKLEPFKESVDRLITDSGVRDDSLAFFKELLGIMNDGRTTPCDGRILCSDLNWRRSLPWREAVALAFDQSHSELSPEYLDGIDSIEIKYGQGDDKKKHGVGLVNQAILIVAWLATRLGWNAKSFKPGDSGYEVSFTGKSSNTISVRLMPVSANEAGLGDVGSIKLTCSKPDSVTVVASQEKGMPGIGVEYFDRPNSANGSNVRHMMLDEAPEGELIDKELQSLGRDVVFKKTVKTAIDIFSLLAGGA